MLKRNIFLFNKQSRLIMRTGTCQSKREIQNMHVFKFPEPLMPLDEKVSFLFLKSFLLVLTKYSFWQADWALGYHSMKFRHFFNVS